MSRARLLLDEMLAPVIAAGLADRGHDVEALVADPAVRRLPDEEVLALASAQGRALVSSNVRDFALLDRQWREQGRSHAGVVLVPSASFPQDRGSIGAVASALDAAAAQGRLPGANGLVFLTRA